MTDDDIIKCFFDKGCINEQGQPLPLKNCEKIHGLYMEELRGGLCSSCQKRSIKIKYMYRLKVFLNKERKNKATA